MNICPCSKVISKLRILTPKVIQTYVWLLKWLKKKNMNSSFLIYFGICFRDIVRNRILSSRQIGSHSHLYFSDWLLLDFREYRFRPIQLFSFDFRYLWLSTTDHHLWRPHFLLRPTNHLVSDYPTLPGGDQFTISSNHLTFSDNPPHPPQWPTNFDDNPTFP